MTPVAPSVIVKAMNTTGDVALLRTGSRDINCEITASYAACGANQLIASRALTPNDFSDPIWWAQVGLAERGVAESKADAPEYQGTERAPQTLTRGTSVTFGRFTCTGSADAASCWNTRTGHGFTITSRTIKPF